MPDPNAPWLTATGAGPAPATVTVSVNTTGLAPGIYQGNVILIAPASGNSPFNVPVSLTVSATPNLIAAPTSLSVTYRQLDPTPDPIQIHGNQQRSGASVHAFRLAVHDVADSVRNFAIFQPPGIPLQPSSSP